MNFTYENQGANTYLVYEMNDTDSLDTLSLGMLTNNTIPGLTKVLFTQIDSARYIKYNISAHVTMQQFFSGIVNRKRLLGVFGGIVDGLMSAEDYMIDTASILLDPQYIFVDVSTCAATLICLPILDGERTNHNFGAFFKGIMVNTQFDQTENSDHVAKIFNFLNGSAAFSLQDFKKLLTDLKNEASELPAQAPAAKPQPAPQSVPQPQQPVVKQAPTVAPQPKVVPSSAPSQPVLVKPRPIELPIVAPQKAEIPMSQPQPAVSAEPEKKMSMFYLLQHYNKENKEIYKQQQATKKTGASAKPTKTPKEKKTKADPGFAVPGQASQKTNTPFAIPGQPAPSVQAEPQPEPVAQQPAVQQPVARQPEVQQPVVQQPTAQQPVVQQTVIQTPRQSVHFGETINFGETTVLCAGRPGETVVLNGTMQQVQVPKPHLVRSRNNETIPLNKPVFRIGKEKSYVDYFIGDNTAVSRSHADIITRDGAYFVVDTNSTNHTFVNGKMIPSNVETEIHDGDKLRFGNEDFEFRLL